MYFCVAEQSEFEIQIHRKTTCLMNFKDVTLRAAALVLLTAGGCGDPTPGENAQFGDLPFEMPAVPRPAIPARTVSVVDFGGVGDGHALNTSAFAAAIDTLSARGGGRVEVPEGVWYTGPIVLKDNIELHLAQNALIVFDNDPAAAKASERKTVVQSLIGAAGFGDHDGFSFQYEKSRSVETARTQLARAVLPCRFGQWQTCMCWKLKPMWRCCA